jgi:hypothetical protein
VLIDANLKDIEATVMSHAIEGQRYDERGPTMLEAAAKACAQLIETAGWFSMDERTNPGRGHSVFEDE